MSTLYITEFSELAPTINGVAAVAAQPPLQEQTVAISSGSATPTNAFTAATRFVRLHTDVVCSIEFGPASAAAAGSQVPGGVGPPVATATKARMAANQTEYFAVPRGLAWTVAVITNS